LIFSFEPWDSKTNQSIQGHEAPALSLDIDASSSLVASGSADSTVKVWDIEGAFCTHNFKGHRGIVTVVKFLNKTLFSGGEDGTIKMWSLDERVCIGNFKNHVSVVRDLDFFEEHIMVSAGRDKVICIWDIPSRKCSKVIPVFEVQLFHDSGNFYRIFAEFTTRRVWKPSAWAII
jgi:U3 small nucleolar RNA-associated protein 13